MTHPEDKMSEGEGKEQSQKHDAAGAGMYPMCGTPSNQGGPTAMMRGMNPMAAMAKMPAMCMAFMVTVPALLGLGVGFAIGRGTKSR